jgi:sugar phosphate isomerase/epimerase
MNTRTGNFPIGFRLGWTQWYKDFPAVVKWAKDNGFAAIDINGYTPEISNQMQAAGLRIGSVDLLDFGKLGTTDEGLRKELIAKNVEYIKTTAAAGCKLFFTIVPGEQGAPRAENYKRAVEIFQPLADAADKASATIIVEGYPGGPPHYAVLCCTPESVRAILRDCGPGMGLNYDPSHLIRLGVDPLRFLNEFLPHIHHVHGKDTELFAEAQYEFGIYQDSVFEKPHGFGQNIWRYTIPGAGRMGWSAAFKLLADSGYEGVVSVELEDEHYNGTEDGEKRGLLNSLAFLKTA